MVGGHSTNVTVIGHLLGRNDVIVHDSLIHNSIVQGAILSGARRVPFRHLDPELWDRTNHNPVRMLQLSRQARLEEVSQDKAFLRELKQVHEAFKKYLERQSTYGKVGAGSAISSGTGSCCSGSMAPLLSPRTSGL